MDIKRIKSDINGNPRFVFHFLALSNSYDYALRLSRKIGGRKFHNNQYGGGIAVQAYSESEVNELILSAKEVK